MRSRPPESSATPGGMPANNCPGFRRDDDIRWFIQLQGCVYETQTIHSASSPHRSRCAGRRPPSLFASAQYLGFHPLGNPQNLYLYGKSGMSIGGFVLLMLPYTLVSLLLLLAWAALVCRKASAAPLRGRACFFFCISGDQKIILLYLVLFAVCLLSVIRVLPYGIAFAAVLVCVLLQTRTPCGQWTIPCF